MHLCRKKYTISEANAFNINYCFLPFLLLYITKQPRISKECKQDYFHIIYATVDYEACPGVCV